ncbi:MAG: HAD family hydrolase [Cyanobacteria bacterium MAG IRC1_bin_28]|nr:HAD family hydrolase [Cyanobacteria bacterium MAG IRC1_bin_28]
MDCFDANRGKDACPQIGSGNRPAILALDLDGVLVDGMEEYWRSSLHVVRSFGAPRIGSNGEIPPAFRHIRPWVHTGWEMVVVWALAHGAAEEAFLQNYPGALRQWQGRLGQSSAVLQGALERHRSDCLLQDRQGWLAQHRLYPGVAERLRRCGAEEGVDWVVVTTKGQEFAAALLEQDGLQPTAVYGREHGPKSRVLRRLLEQRQPVWFVEDRLPTLETVMADPHLRGIGCYLAAWGYLRHADRQQLRPPAHWLGHATFCAPFPAWPT